MRKNGMKRILAFATAGLLAMSMAMPVMAEEDRKYTGATAVGENNVVVNLVKEVSSPNGLTPTTNATFTFNFAPDPTTGTHRIDDQKVSTINKTTSTTAPKYIGTVDNFLSDGPAAHGITAPGEYVFTVTEAQSLPNYNQIAGTNKYTKYDADKNIQYTYVMSQAEYKLHLIASSKVDGNKVATGELYFQYAYALKTKDDAGEATTSNKIDPSITPDAGTGAGNDFRFVNQYLEQKGTAPGTDPDPTDPKPHDPEPKPDDNGHYIGKIVKGAAADTSKPFTFKVTMAKATLDFAEHNYAWICTKGTDGNFVKKDGATVLDFAPGATTEVKLKGGEFLVFPKTTVGATFTVVEDGAVGAGYVATGDVVSDDTASTVAAVPLANGTDFTTDAIAVGEKANSATITNTKESNVPGGINASSMPYVLMLLAIAGCAVCGIVVKKRMAK